MKKDIIEEEKKEVEIVYRDRGIDYDRLEHMVKMLKDKKNEYQSNVWREQNRIEKDCQNNFYTHFELDSEKLAIDKIDNQISRLQDRRKRYEKLIKKVTKCAGDEYGRYDEPKTGSKVDIWTKECVGNIVKDSTLTKIVDECSENIYLAHNIDEAIDIYKACLSELDQLTSSKNGSEERA